MYINTATNQIVSEQEIRNSLPNVSFATPFNPEGYAVIFPSPQPEYNQYTQMCFEIPPVLSSKGQYEQQWEVSELTGEDLAAGLERQAADSQVKEAARVAALWQSAHDYEYKEISGSAVGLLAMGVLQGKPKCAAVQSWIQSIWDEYYTRRAGTSIDTDYSVCGTIPHTIPELMAELSV